MPDKKKKDQKIEQWLKEDAWKELSHKHMPKHLLKASPKKGVPPLLILYRVLAVAAALVVAGYVLFNLFAAAPVVREAEIDLDGDGVADAPPVMVTTMVTENNEGELVEYEVEIPLLAADRKKEFYTFLVVGQDQTGGGGAGNTDTMMLGTYDVPNQKLSVLSLPRDTYVHLGGRTVLLNSVYSRSGGGTQGIKRLQQKVGELTGVRPDFYVMLQWEALGELVDAIGGVEFEVPFDMYYNDLSQGFIINLKGGLQTLNGAKAMQLIRWRQNSIGDTGKKDPHYGYADGDLGRIRTQQAFLKAVIKKCLQPDVLLPRLGNYIQFFQKNVETDLEMGHIAYFAKSAIGNLDMEGVYMATVPNAYSADGHVVPLGSQLAEIVNQHFNPYRYDISLRSLDIVTAQEVAPAKPAEDEEDTAATPEPSEDPQESESPAPTETPKGSESPAPTETPKGSESPAPTETPKGSESPAPTETSKVSETPKVSESPRESQPPRESEEPEPPPEISQQPAPTPEPPPTPAAEPPVEEAVLPPEI